MVARSPGSAMMEPMTSAQSQPADHRRIDEYRIAARDLRPGDLVNTSPGAEDDWQRVLAVFSADSAPSDDAEMQALINEIGDRYVVVELSDLAPVDSNIYFSAGVAMAYATDDGPDQAVTESVSDPDGVRTYLYTIHEVVTVRSRG
jgi:hypothetical protein